MTTASVVVVDNASTDSSVEALRARAVVVRAAACSLARGPRSVPAPMHVADAPRTGS